MTSKIATLFIFLSSFLLLVGCSHKETLCAGCEVSTPNTFLTDGNLFVDDPVQWGDDEFTIKSPARGLGILNGQIMYFGKWTDKDRRAVIKALGGRK